MELPTIGYKITYWAPDIDDEIVDVALDLTWDELKERIVDALQDDPTLRLLDVVKLVEVQFMLADWEREDLHNTRLAT